MNKKRQNIVSLITTFNDFLVINKTKNPFGMNITMVQGLLYSIASVPCLIMPSDWLYVIFGGFPTFQSVKQQEEIITTILKLHKFIQDELSLNDKNNFYLWQSAGSFSQIEKATDNTLIDFCSGYVKGYLLDPIIRDAYVDLPDFSLAFLLSIIKLGTTEIKDPYWKNLEQKNQIDLKNDSRKAVVDIIAANYKIWTEARKLHLPKTYLWSNN